MRELERVDERFLKTGRLNMRCIECNVRQVLQVLIAKGQGNFESLNGIEKPGLFHLFMAKCSLVTKQLGVENHAILCAESHTL